MKRIPFLMPLLVALCTPNTGYAFLVSFSVPGWLRKAPSFPRLRQTSCTSSTLGLLSLKVSAADLWAEAYKKGSAATPPASLTLSDTSTLLAVAMRGDPKRKDTFAEVGGGFGEAMAIAAEVYEFGQAALFVQDDMQETMEGVLGSAKGGNIAFERCQIVSGDVQDLGPGSKLLTYFDVILANTIGPQWGLGADGPASALSAAAGGSCLEGSRIVTVGRRLVSEEGVWAFDLLESVQLSNGAQGYVWEVSRSAKSSPPDTPPRENLLLPGNCVRIVGLQKATEYNDLEAVILEIDEGGVFSVMIDVTCKQLRLRANNIEPLGKLEA